MNKIDKFIQSDDVLVSETAAQIKQYMDAGLSKSEIEELSQDLLELEYLDEQISSVERKIYIKRAFEVIKTIISNIP